MVYGLKELALDGAGSGPFTALLVGAGFGWLFVRRQLHLSDPHFDVTLFRNRGFSAALGINLSGGVVMAGTFLLLSLYLQLVLGYSPLVAGLCLVPMNIAMAVATNVTPHLAKRFPTPPLMAGGLLVAAAGMALITGVEASGGLPLLMIGFSAASIGIAVPSVLAIGLILGSVPPEKAGAASGLSETSGELGIALGVAAMGSLAGAMFRDRLVVPEGVPASLADSARESITGAVAVAGRIPGDTGAELLGSAREAFTAGLTVAGGLGAALFLAMSVVALTVFRGLAPSEPAEDDPPAIPAA